MALIPKCVDCPDRDFDSLGSARGHANRMGHSIIQVDEVAIRPLSGTELVKVEGGSPVLSGELGEQLEELAGVIRSQWEKGQSAVKSAWEARYAIAEAMVTARKLLRSDLEYGRWLKEQRFPFGTTYAQYFRRLGEHLPEVRQLVDNTLSETGDEPGIKKVLQTVDPRAPKAKDDLADLDVPVAHGAALEAIHGLLYGEALSRFMDIPLDEKVWLAVPAEERASLMHEFKLIMDRMYYIGTVWKDDRAG